MVWTRVRGHGSGRADVDKSPGARALRVARVGPRKRGHGDERGGAPLLIRFMRVVPQTALPPCALASLIYPAPAAPPLYPVSRMLSADFPISGRSGVKTIKRSIT